MNDTELIKLKLGSGRSARRDAEHGSETSAVGAVPLGGKELLRRTVEAP